MTSTTHTRLSEAVEQYLAARAARYSPTTVEQDRFVTTRFVAAVGDPYVRNLTPSMVEQWFNSLLAKHTTRDGVVRPKVQPGTFNYYYARIKALVKYLTTRGLLRTDVLAHVLPMTPERKKRLQPTPDVLWRLLDSTSDPRDRALLSAAVNTGLRANEIAAIRVGDVDLDSLTLRVRISKSKMEDDMPITSDLATELTSWLERYAKFQIADLDRIMQPGDYLFPARLGPKYRWRIGEDGDKERYHVDGGYDPLRPVLKLHRIAQEALRKVGLPSQHQGIHTLRRSAARAFFDQLVREEGYDSALRVVSSFLHHSNQSTTEGYFGLSSETRKRDESLRGRSLLGPRPEPATSGVVVPLAREATDDSPVLVLFQGQAQESLPNIPAGGPRQTRIYSQAHASEERLC